MDETIQELSVRVTGVAYHHQSLQPWLEGADTAITDLQQQIIELESAVSTKCAEVAQELGTHLQMQAATYERINREAEDRAQARQQAAEESVRSRMQIQGTTLDMAIRDLASQLELCKVEIQHVRELNAAASHPVTRSSAEPQPRSSSSSEDLGQMHARLDRIGCRVNDGADSVAELQRWVRSNGNRIPDVEIKLAEMGDLSRAVAALNASSTVLHRDVRVLRTKVEEVEQIVPNMRRVEVDHAEFRREVNGLVAALSQGMQAKMTQLVMAQNKMAAENVVLKSALQSVYQRVVQLEQQHQSQPPQPTIMPPQQPRPAPAAPTVPATVQSQPALQFAAMPQAPQTIQPDEVAKIIRQELQALSRSIAQPIASPIGAIISRPNSSQMSSSSSMTTHPTLMASSPLAVMQAPQPVQIRALGAGPVVQAPHAQGAAAGVPHPPPAPVTTAPMLVNPLMLSLPIDRPTKFSGQRRDWRKFWREFEKYDRDLQTCGAVGEATRLRALEGLLDRAGQCKLTTLQKEAEFRGVPLTLLEAKSHLDQMFETSGSQDAKFELKSLLPDWSGGRPAGPAWRQFAEEFRMLAALSPEISEEEKREHLMAHCLTQQLATFVMTEDRKRAKKPKAIVYGFHGVTAPQIRQWLAGQAVDTVRITPINGGHQVVCEAQSDLRQILTLDKCRVQVGAGVETLTVQAVDTRITVNEVLDLITEKLADEEVYTDTRRVAMRAQGKAVERQDRPDRQYPYGARDQQRQYPRRQVQAVDSMPVGAEDDYDCEYYEEDATHATVSAVEQQHPQLFQHREEKGGHKGGGKGKGGGQPQRPTQTLAAAPQATAPAANPASAPAIAHPTKGNGGKSNGKGGAQDVQGASAATQGYQPRPWCSQCNGEHLTVQCPQLQCWYCEEYGHAMTRCPYIGRKGKGGRGPRPVQPPQ